MRQPIIHAVGIICFRGDDVLLIRRAKPPRDDEWSIPGGRIEPGESEEAACLRELKEETGITARLLGKVAMVPAQFKQGLYHLHDYAAIWEGGEPLAGDDAKDAKFVSLDELAKTPLWPPTREIIEQARSRYIGHIKTILGDENEA